MKTKNILKIGVFSIVILSLLISPILKSNSPQVRAESECEKEENKGICINKGLKCTTLGKYKGSSFKCANYKDDKCCIPGVETSDDARAQYTSEVQAKIAEEPAVDICKGVGIESDRSWSILGVLSSGWWEHKICVFQKGIIEGLGKMFAAMIRKQTELIIWAFNPATYGGFVKNSAVQEVWKFIRDLINLVLVLALVIIAITTILGMKKYSWQQTLWKLIIVALLVNFSLVMAGMILDVSHFLAYTFLNLAKKNSATIAESMIKSFEVETLNSEKAYELSGVSSVTKETTTGWGLSWGNFFIASLGLISIGLFALIALLAIFIAMIIRSFIIVALLCVTPVAFAAWIFPDTEQYWKMWWQQFIKWCTFPIIFGVMLWIGVSMVNSLGNLGSSANLGMIPFIIRMFLFSMFLVGGLIFSIQGGGAVAQSVTKQAGKLGLAAGAYVGTKMKGKMVESPTYKKAGQILTKVPLLKGVGEEMMVAGEKAKVARVKEHQKSFENVSTNTLKQITGGPSASPLVERDAFEKQLAATNELTKRKELEDKNIPFIDRYKDDPRLDIEPIAKAVPHFFKMEDNKLVRTGDTIKEKVQALSNHKGSVLAKETQNSNFIKSIVSNAGEKAKREGKTQQEIQKAKDEAFDETFQEIFKILSPEQSAGFVQGLSSKDLIEGSKDLIEGKWGGSEGKIAQAIEKDEQTKKRFFEELLPASRVLREFSGIKEGEKEKKGEGPKETPPHPGWVKKSGIWRSQ